MQELFAILDAHGIPYQRFDHPAVFTCEESEKLPTYPGAGTKNLFLRNEKKTQYFLVSVGHDKRVDLKELGKLLGTKLSFGDAEHLKNLLGVEPGSVTLFGALHDVDKIVDIIIDRAVWDVGSLQCHPLVNTATLVLETKDVERFFKAVGHPYRVLDVPAKS